MEELEGSGVSLQETQPSQMALDLTMTDLLRFLQQYQVNCPNLQMICPLSGVPLPYIIIDLDQSLEMKATMEFTLQLGRALVKYMLASRATAAKISY